MSDNWLKKAGDKLRRLAGEEEGPDMAAHDHHDHDHDHDHHTPPDKILPPDVQAKLKKVFDGFHRDVDLHYFGSGRDDEDQLARDLIGAFALVSKRLRFTEHTLSDPEAALWGVTAGPTFAFNPGEIHVKYLGIPLGEEGRTLVETLVLLGHGHSGLSEQAAAVVKSLIEPRRVMVFVSPTCPYCPQQAVNAIKAAVENPDMVETEIVDTSFYGELAEKYSAYSVPQTWANETRIAEGAQSEELFAASLEELTQVSYFIPKEDAEQVETDVVIVGGGPAGLSAAIYAARSGLTAVVVEKEQLGGQITQTPVVENYPGVVNMGGRDLADIMVNHALQYVKVFPREAVQEIKLGETMIVTTSVRRFTARAVLLATGAKHRRLGTAGEQRFSGRGVSYCSTCDGPLFRGKKVALVGGGNSAVTEALHLHHLGVDVTLIHRGDKLRAEESLTADLFSKNIPVLWNTEVREVRGDERVSSLELYNNKTEKTDTLAVDGLFVAIGYDPENELARALGVELSPGGYVAHDGYHRTNVQGIYSAGDLEGGYKQIVTAAGAGAGAAMTIFEDLTRPYWKRG